MRLYQAVFILSPEMGPDGVKSQEKNLEDLVKKFQGQVLQKFEAGKKLLGYPIRKFREGNVLYFDFQLDPSKLVSLREALSLHEELMKFMLTVKPKKASAPPRGKTAASAPMASPVAKQPAAHA